MSIDLNAFIPGSESWSLNKTETMSDTEFAVLTSELEHENRALSATVDLMCERANNFEKLHAFYKKHGSFEMVGEVVNVNNYVGGQEGFSEQLYTVGMESIKEGFKKAIDWIVKMWKKFTDWVKAFFQKSNLEGRIKEIGAKLGSAKLPVTAEVLPVNDKLLEFVNNRSYTIDKWLKAGPEQAESLHFNAVDVELTSKSLSAGDIKSLCDAYKKYVLAINQLREKGGKAVDAKIKALGSTTVKFEDGKYDDGSAKSAEVKALQEVATGISHVGADVLVKIRTSLANIKKALDAAAPKKEEAAAPADKK